MKRKKSILIFFLTCSFFFFLNREVLASEKIDNFETIIRLNRDSSIDVTEVISYDFGYFERHGIYRDIPVKYKARGGNYNLRISNVSVFDQNQDPYKFRTSPKGKYFEIKIGDPDLYISGQRIYVINYRINRAINYFEMHDELYWNITGNEWNVPISKASAKIILPELIGEEDLKISCFAGKTGSKENCENIYLNKNVDGINEIDFFERNLYKHEGLTVIVGLPKGILIEPSFFKKTFDLIWDNKLILVPILTLVILLYLWWHKGRDPKGRGTIIAQFGPPDNLSPIEIGTIVDERVNKRDISAEIINLAVNGYIKIKRIKKKISVFSFGDDYILQKLRKGDDLKNEFQKDLLRDLFKKATIIKEGKKVIIEVRLSRLKDNFYGDLNHLTKAVYREVAKKGYFVKNPIKVKLSYFLTGMILMSVCNIVSVKQGNIIDAMSFIVSGILCILFGTIMPKKTKKGVFAKEHILGLKRYLRVAEKERLKFHNAPEKNPEHFEKLLPYAIVLKIEKEWAEQFKDIYDHQPSWYSDPQYHSFNAFILTSHLNDFSRTSNAVLASRPRSASGGGSGFGGGFSGGGFGGGGGGSW